MLISSNQPVLSWGRKFFFGIGWVIISVLALNYHQSLIIPRTSLGWLYYLATFIGHYGLLLTIVYFLVYSPLVRIFPHFRWARLWALTLMMVACFLLIVDSFVFAQYRYHLNRFILDLLFGGAALDIFDFSFMTYSIVIGGLGVLFYFLWNYQNKQWALVQKDHAPVKNWYFALIMLCQLLSHGLHVYGSAVALRSVTGLAPLFPLYFPLTANRFLKKHKFIPEQAGSFAVDKNFKDFYYPHGDMKCGGIENKNVLFLIIDSWRTDEMSQEITPFIYEYQKKAMSLGHHFSGSNSTRGGIFNIFYSLPATYWDITLNNQTPPVLMDEFRKRGYDFGIFAAASLIVPEFDRTVFAEVPNLRISTEGYYSDEKDLKINEEWKAWLNQQQTSRKTKPFVGVLFYDSPHSYSFPASFKKDFSPVTSHINYLALNNFTDPLPIKNRHKKSVSFVDTLVEDVLKHLKAQGLEENTVVVITSDHGQEISDNKKNYWGHNSNYSPIQLKVPFVMMWPGKAAIKMDVLTTHYDIVPTLMSGLWDCQNKVENYSYGSSLFDYRPKDWHISASYLDYGVLDFKKNLIMTVDAMGEYSVTDMQLNEVDKLKANEKLIVDVFRDLTRFKKRPSP